MPEDLPKFRAKSWRRFRGRGWIAVVENDRERHRQRPGLVGQMVLIDGDRLKVAGFEAQPGAAPIAKGEIIGLFVKGTPSTSTSMARATSTTRPAAR
jgi:hypothetical protein